VTQPVVIAGGGPAGAAAAIALQARGVDCLILDARTFPRDKVCGDVLLPEALGALAGLGLDLEELRALAYTCEGAVYRSPAGHEASGVFRARDGRPTPWWMVKRHTFDAWLVRQAEFAGAELWQGHRILDVSAWRHGSRTVRYRRPDGRVGELETGMVIGADGASSAVARSVGAIRPRAGDTCLAARAYVRGVRQPAPRLEIFTTRRTLPGCAWVVPVGPDEVNVGLGLLKSDARNLGCTPQSLFAEVRARCPELAARLGTAHVELKGWWLPGATERRELIGDGYLLAGDAGAMVDPFTGHGIHHALMAGAIAGDVVSFAWRQNDFRKEALTDYRSRCQSQFLRQAVRAGHLQRIHSKPAIADAAAYLAGRHRGMRWLLMALLGHVEERAAVLSTRQLALAVCGRAGA
jgi:menaquinone-9 beta-reductase